MVRYGLLLGCLLFPTLLQAAPAVTALAYHPQGKLLAAGTYQEVVIIDLDKNDVLGTIAGQTKRVTALAFSRDGKQLAIASGEPGKSGQIRLYDVPATGAVFKPSGTVISAHADAIYALDYAPDGKMLASAGYDRLIKLWNPETRQEIRVLKDHSDTVYGLSFHPQGKWLASAGADRAVKVWDVQTGTRLYTLGDATDWVQSVQWHPEGKQLAAAGVDRSLRVWDANGEGGKLVHSVFAHTEAITKILYSHDGKNIYSMSKGKSLKKWDTTKMVEALVFPPADETLLSLAIKPDGKQIAIGRFDGVCQLLETQAGKQVSQPLPVKPKPPGVSKLVPNFVPRGQTSRIQLEGTALDGVTEIVVAGATIPVKILPEQRTGQSLWLEVAVPKHQAVGTITLSAKSLAGASTPVNLIIDRYPAIPEKAAKDSPKTGALVTLPGTFVGGMARAGEADFYRFEAKAGQQIGIQVLTSTVGSKLEPILELFDSDGRILGESTNSLLGYTCPKAGTYALGIRDKDYRGGSEFFYRIHMGDVPIVTHLFPVGASRGKATPIQLDGVHLGELRSVIANIPADSVVGSRFALSIPTSVSEKPLGDLSVLVGEFPEKNAGKDNRLAVPGTLNGILKEPGETHLVEFAAKKGEPLIIEVNARRHGSPLDSVLEMVDSEGKGIQRATLRCVARTFTTFRDQDSVSGSLRLEAWNELAMNDYVYVGTELLRIKDLPPNPDADCSFVTEAGQRIGFLGTTPGHISNGSPMYKVEIHPPGSIFPPNGLPVFQIPYRNDDGGPGYGKDSRIMFDPPADGIYRVRVGDARAQGGAHFTYRLTVRPPRPDFSITFTPPAPSVWKGGSVPITVTATRLDDYTGPIAVKLENLPPGLEAPETFIEEKQTVTTFALYAKNDVVLPMNVAPLKLTGKAMIAGKEIVRESVGQAPKIIEGGDIVTTTNLQEVAIQPGKQAKLRVKIERHPQFKGRVPLEVRGLPHGVRVLDIGLNGILITERDSEREIVIYAEPWVQPMQHPVIVLARREGKNTEHGAKSVLLKIDNSGNK